MKYMILIVCCMMITSCSYYVSDPTRPDIRNNAKKVQQEKLKQYGPQN